MQHASKILLALAVAFSATAVSAFCILLQAYARGRHHGLS